MEKLPNAAQAKALSSVAQFKASSEGTVNVDTLMFAMSVQVKGAVGRINRTTIKWIGY